MAKPGSAEAARLSGLSRTATDLSKAQTVPAAVAEKVLESTERRLGLRCAGCGERIRGPGFLFTRIDAVMSEGKPSGDVVRLSACSGSDDCDFAMRARDGATVMELVEYVWLDELPPDGGGEQAPAAEEPAEAKAA